MGVSENPYQLGPVDDLRLLRTRRTEIALALEAVAPEAGRSRHALILGDCRTGRTSTLNEVARRAEQARQRLAIPLHIDEQDLTISGLIRCLMNAAVERIVRDYEVPPDWYLVWCNRMYLRDRTPMTLRDFLVSGLAFAADSCAVIDRSVIIRDLRALARIAAERSTHGVLVCVDDADPLLEDVALTERLIDALESAPGWTLLMAARPSGLRHLREAISPCLRHLQRIPLTPFWAPDQVRTCLTAPLDASDGTKFIPDDAHQLLFDVVQLTSGNPFEIALVARHLWAACLIGEQEHYELTPRVLQRFVHDMVIFTGIEGDVLDGSVAVRRLAPEQLGPALRLIAFSRLTTRQIAVARLLGIPAADGAINDRFMSCDIDTEEARVVEELEELQRLGIVSLTADDRFKVQGGRAAEIALKSAARSVLETNAAEQMFGMPFLASVGLPLAQDAARRAGELLGGTRRLASLRLYNPTSIAQSARLRSTLMAQPFAGLDVDVTPIDAEAFEALVQLLIAPCDHTLVLVDFTLAAGDGEIDFIDVWRAGTGVESHEVNQALSDMLEHWEPFVAKAGITWKGSQCRVLSHSEVAPAIVQLIPEAATAAVTRLFREWWSGARRNGLERALVVADIAVAATHAHRVPDWERGWEASGMLSRLGFLLSLSDERLQEARDTLERARERGPADGWVTAWNLANISCRLGDFDDATRRLDRIEQHLDGWSSVAFLAVFVPGRPTRDCVASVSSETLQEFLKLQRALIRFANCDDTVEALTAALPIDPQDEEVKKLVGWVKGLVASSPVDRITPSS